MRPMIVCSCAVLAAIVLLTTGCGTMNAVRALDKGESALAVSLGGPVTRFAGQDIPLPYAVARYRYGLTDRLGLSAGGHLLLPVLGDIGLDAGVSYQVLKQNGWVPECGISGGLTGMFGPLDSAGEARAFPDLSASASWLFGNRAHAYLGVQSMYQFRLKPYVVFAPVVGAEVRLFRGLSLTLEGKWYAPTELTKPRVVNFRIPIAEHGAVGFVLGVNYLFGGWYE